MQPGTYDAFETWGGGHDKGTFHRHRCRRQFYYRRDPAAYKEDFVQAEVGYGC